MERLTTPSSSKIGLKNNYEVGTSNFTFCKRNERIDWKKVASIDIAKLSKDLDFHLLQDNILHVTFCDIEHEMDGTVDPNYIKLFALAQLIIEYLLHSQEYLANVIQLLEENLKQSSEGLEEEKSARAKDRKLIIELRKENERRKLQLASQQQYFEAVCKESSQCPYCPKVFVGPSYLQSHVMRRHPEFAKENQSNTDSSERQSTKIATMEKELQEIKEKMKPPEPKFTAEKSVQVSQEEDELAHARNILQSELKALQEKHEKSENALHEQLKALQEKHEKSENALHELQKKYAKMDSSHFESIENCLQQKTLLMEKENGEVAALKEQLKTELNYMESDIEKKLKRQGKEWKAKFNKMMQEHASEIDKLNINLKNAIIELNMQREKSVLREKEYEEQINDLVKSRNAEVLQKEEEEMEMTVELQANVVPSPKETPPPPPPRTYMASRIAKSPLKERNILGTVKSHRLQTALESSPCLLDGLRVELNGLFHDKLKAYGIGTSPTSANAIRKASEAAKAERKALSKKYRNFGKIRDHFEQVVDETGKNKLWKQNVESSPQEPQSIIRKAIHSTQDKLSSTPKSSPLHNSSTSLKRTPAASVSKPVSHPILVKSDSNSDDQKVTPKKLSFKTPVQSSIPEMEEDSTDEELSDEESLNNFRDIDTRKLTMLGFPQTSNPPPKPAIRKLLSASKHIEESDQDDEDETFDSFDDEFDDDDVDNDGKDSIHDHYQPIHVRPPTGQLVSRLTQSIEHQLQGRNSKPPAGSVDITPDVNRNLVKEYSKDEENDDSLSSLEDQLKGFESKFQANQTASKTHNKDNISSPNQKTGRIETQEPSHRKKKEVATSSWDSDDDISFEEIE